MSSDVKARRQELFLLRDAAAAKGHDVLALEYNRQAAQLAIKDALQRADTTDLTKPTRH